MATTHEMKPTSCPDCGYVFDRATGKAGGKGPGEGDFSVCVNCGAVLRFDADLRANQASEHELAELTPDLTMQLLLASDYFKARGKRR